MDIPKPEGSDVTRAIGFLAAYWVITVVECLVLASRYSIKAWMQWKLPKVSTPQRIWGFDDIFYGLGTLFDVIHVALTTKSWQWGLGRHFFYLLPEQRSSAMMWNFISQPLGITASMFLRTGIFCFLYSCLAQHNRRLKWTIIACGIAQILVNLVTALQIILQCGPNPYRPTNRALYFRYLWTPHPEDGSVACQLPTVQQNIGYVNCACNSTIDFVLICLTAYEIWQFVFRTPNNTAGNRIPWIGQLRRLNSRTRNQRVWQTILLCGPLVVSGVAVIVKTNLLSVIGSRLDFTWNIVPFLLWARIENSSLLISACGPTFRLYTRSLLNRRKNNEAYASSHGLQEVPSRQAAELSGSTLRAHDTAAYGPQRTNNKALEVGETPTGATPTGSETNLAEGMRLAGQLQATTRTKTEVDVRTIEASNSL